MENSTLQDEIGCVNPSSARENGAHRIYAADNDHQIKDREFNGHKNDSFIVDIDQFSSLLPEKDVNANSRITLQKSVSRKGMQREQKTNFSFNNDRNHSPRANSARGALHGTSSTLEKPLVGATENTINPQHHNSITIMNCAGGGSVAVAAAAVAAATADGKLGGRRYSFRRTSSSWTIDPRRILFFFATLSSMGTILLIYFTLSMSKVKGDDSLLN